VFRRQSSLTLSDVVGAGRAPKWIEVVHNHASDSQYTTWAKRFLDDCRRPRRWRHSSSRHLPWCSDHAVNEKMLPSTAWLRPQYPRTLSRMCCYRMHTESLGKLACELQRMMNILQADLTHNNDANIPWTEFHRVLAIWTRAKVYPYVAFMTSHKWGSHFAIDLFNVEIMACA
jgi:hypothetical protein